MATLQKFKLLATQCGVVQSPTRSPRTSPLVHLRRKKTTLRMLLTRSISNSSARRSPPRKDSLPRVLPPLPPPEKKRDTLKDLFVSSPITFDDEDEEEENKKGKMIGGKCEVFRMRVNGLGVEPAGSPRPGWIGFRHRALIRRAWRPMLVAIVEEEDESNFV
ncbi:conserved hypothetical protein [Ricinus communis]|uniref:Uncharacterized protein n=1 Tax=Ricinus communis TaxID=3988 RepID=B9SLZ4_RICCO|nr:conserved hypothetical protein [Ricinus communis]|eukprot:XP_015579568.1 uncharacterized protein LOC8271484 [Ricinus communis]